MSEAVYTAEHYRKQRQKNPEPDPDFDFDSDFDVDKEQPQPGVQATIDSAPERVLYSHRKPL